MSLVAAIRRSGVPIAVFAIGLVATTLVVLQTRRTAQSQDQERFEVAVDGIEDTIQDRLDLYAAMLRAGAGLVSAGNLRTPEQFRAFVQRLELADRYPGAQGIGYSARVRAEDVGALVTAQRRLGRPTFHVWPEDPRAEYQAIVYLEPLDRRNLAAIGYDMSTEPTRRAAMELARDSGQPAASGLVTLVQEIDEVKQPGFLIYVPIYEGGGIPGSVEERRRRLQGFIYSPFRAGDLFTGILGRNPRPRAGFALFDGAPTPASLIYRTAVSGAAGRLSERRSFDVAGRQWTAEFFSTEALDSSSLRGLVPIAAWGGGALTLLLTGLTALQTRARERAHRARLAASEASRRFEQLANSIPQLAWTASPDGAIYWYNDRWYEYTGSSPDEMAGSGWQQVHDSAHLPAVLARWRHSLATGEPFEMEHPLRAADGTFRWFLTRVLPFRSDAGAIVHWFGTSTDVQYRRDAERALREHSETLEIVNRTGRQLAGELDLDKLIQALTDAGTRLTRAQFGAFFHHQASGTGESYELYTLSGAPRSAFDHLPIPRNLFSATVRGEHIVRSADITLDPRDDRNAPHHGAPGDHLPVRSYLAVPVKSRSGEVFGGLFFGHADAGVFTEQAEHIVAGIAAQAAIAIDNARLYGRVQTLLAGERAARDEAERISRLKDEFLATLSHELRTPLNAVVGWAHILNSGTLSDAKRQVAVDTILRNARIQSQLIEDLLDMSRIISGGVRIDMGLVHIAHIIEAATSAVRPAAAAKRITVIDTSGPDPGAVRGDSRRLQQIVWNLLTNAIKFTPPGGTVTIHAHTRNGETTVTVSDTGVGIDPGFLPHVFERFRQADGSVTRGHGGLGLGLSIVRSLVEMHGGTIRASSDGPNRGATFTMTLPAASEPAPSARAASDPQVSSPVHADALTAITVLVVDDDADAGDLAQEILMQHGARVLLARSGAEALERLRAGGTRVGIIVSDVAMPEMDGYELIRRVRALPPESGGRAPAIALTAYAGAEDQTRAMTAGYDLHLAKPFVPGDLVSACLAVVHAGTA